MAAFLIFSAVIVALVLCFFRLGRKYERSTGHSPTINQPLGGVFEVRMFATFETDPAGEPVVINVEKIVKFQQFGDHTSLFLDDGSTIDVKGGLLENDKRIAAAQNSTEE